MMPQITGQRVIYFLSLPTYLVTLPSLTMCFVSWIVVDENTNFDTLVQAFWSIIGKRWCEGEVSGVSGCCPREQVSETGDQWLIKSDNSLTKALHYKYVLREARLSGTAQGTGISKRKLPCLGFHTPLMTASQTVPFHLIVCPFIRGFLNN